MTARENVAESLDAVQQALGHLAAGLERGGFQEGADAYRQMSEVVVGQWQWAEREGARELEPSFRKIAATATIVAGQLEPYVEAMRRLAALRSLLAEARGVVPGSPEEKVIELLSGADGPLSATDVRKGVALPLAEVRRALASLVAGELVVEVGGGRPRYTVQGAAP